MVYKKKIVVYKALSCNFPSHFYNGVMRGVIQWFDLDFKIINIIENQCKLNGDKGEMEVLLETLVAWIKYDGGK